MNIVEAVYSDKLSLVAMSNLFTKACAAKLDDRQQVPDRPEIPSLPTRELMANLILEETQELLKSLGFVICRDPLNKLHPIYTGVPQPSHPDDLLDIIDQSCDLQYVANGVMVGCGVADVPHLMEVCRANGDKFPQGEPIINPSTGKYLKPEHWIPPNHRIALLLSNFSLKTVGKALMSQNLSNQENS